MLNSSNAWLMAQEAGMGKWHESGRVPSEAVRKSAPLSSSWWFRDGHSQPWLAKDVLSASPHCLPTAHDCVHICLLGTQAYCLKIYTYHLIFMGYLC